MNLLNIPKVGFGCGTKLYKGFQHNVSGDFEDSIKEQLMKALELGMRHIDLAEMYGNEREVSAALRSWMDKDKENNNREKLWITGKTFETMSDVITGCKNSLERLGCKYFDLYLIHSPVEFRNAKEKISKLDKSVTIESIWSDMEKLVEMGLVKHIGISNFRASDIYELMDSNPSIKPAINQVEFNPYLQQPELQKICMKYEIGMEAYSPLASLNLFPNGPVDEVVDQLAKKYNKSAGVILLQYAYQRGYIPITTTSNEGRILSYVDLINGDFSLLESEIAQIDEAGRKTHHRFATFIRFVMSCFVCFCFFFVLMLKIRIFGFV